MNEARWRQAQALAEQLQAAFGDRLLSVCLHGPEDAAEMLVLIKDLGTADLASAQPLMKPWEKHAHALPVFLSDVEWRQSADVFALEYAEIRDSYRLVHGEDCFAGVAVDRASLRLLCELEIYRQLLFLRQRLLLPGASGQDYRHLMRDARPDLCRLFRGVLRLSADGAVVPACDEAVLQQMASAVPGFDPAPFLADNGPTAGRADVLRRFEAYIDQVALVNHYLNQ